MMAEAWGLVFKVRTETQEISRRDGKHYFVQRHASGRGQRLTRPDSRSIQTQSTKLRHSFRRMQFPATETSDESLHFHEQ